MKFALGVFAFVLSFLTSDATSGYPTLTVTPSGLELGIDPRPSLTIECTNGGPYTIESLIISYSDGYLPYEAVASFNNTGAAPTVFAGFLPDDATVIGTTVSGTDEPQSLTITIPEPGADQIGRYECRPKSANDTESRYVRAIYASLHLIHTDFVEFCDEVVELQEDSENLLNNITEFPGYPPAQNLTGNITMFEMLVDELETMVNDTRELVDNFMENATDALECRLNETSKFAKSIELSLFAESDVYNGSGSFYLLSHFSPISFLNAEDICTRRGGKLAEIDDEEEFSFIECFLRPVISHQQYVLFGAKWNGTDYVNRFSGSTASYTNFFDNSPNGLAAAEECLALVLNYRGQAGIRMEDTNCDFIPFGPFDYIHGFICEIPEAQKNVCA